MTSANIPPGEDEGIWEEVYVEQDFDFQWPKILQIDQEGHPILGPGGELLYWTVIRVEAESWRDVSFDLLGVRGAYRYLIMFPPTNDYVYVERFPSQGAQDYLYSFKPDPLSFKIIPYKCTYNNLRVAIYKIRVWQNYTIGRDWIIDRIASEQARDAIQEKNLLT